MADQLKHFFNAALVRSLAAEVQAAYPALREEAFVEACVTGLEALELTPRAWHIAEALRVHLPEPFAEAAAILVAALGPPLAQTEGMGMAPFRYLPFVFYVQRYGVDDFEAAMAAQHALTQRMSAESSIRVYIERYPEEAYARLVEWASDPSPHVRRLVSEGSRPRLPWAPRLRAWQADPAPVVALLELLKDDPVRYVQRSVANNLNDIAKDHPAVAVEVCRRWLEEAPGDAGRRWIVQHALRSRVKQGDLDALAVLGVDEPAEVAVGQVRLPERVVIGGELCFAFVLEEVAGRRQELVVDYAVHFVKARGASSPKVFKLKRLTLEAGASATLQGKVSFAPMTTRRVYPGVHRVEALINGVAHALGEFGVEAPG